MEDEKFRKKIALSTKENLMVNVNEYIEWVDCNDKTGSIVPAIEFSLVSCRNFEQFLTKDFHYMNLWCKYAECFPNPNEIYQKIYDKHLFRKIADFYIRWVDMLLKGDQVDKVLNVFSKAVANDCVPMEKIRERAKIFKLHYKDQLSSIVQKRNVKIMFYSCGTTDENNCEKIMDKISMEEIKAVNYCINKLGKYTTDVNYEKDIQMVPVWIGLLEDKPDADVTMDVTTGLLSINSTLHDDTRMTDSPMAVNRKRESMINNNSLNLSYMNDLSAITLANHTEHSIVEEEATLAKLQHQATLLAQEAKDFVTNCFSQPSLYDPSVYEAPKHLDGVDEQSAFSVYADNSALKPSDNQSDNLKTNQGTPYVSDKGANFGKRHVFSSVATHNLKQPQHKTPATTSIANAYDDSVHFKSILSTQMTSTPFVYRTTTSSSEESVPNTNIAATSIGSIRSREANHGSLRQALVEIDNCENISQNVIVDNEKVFHQGSLKSSTCALTGIDNVLSLPHKKSLPCITKSLNNFLNDRPQQQQSDFIEIFNKKVQLEIVKKITPHIKNYEGFHHFTDDTPFKIDIGKTFCYENEKWLVESFIGEGGFASVFLVRTTFPKNTPHDPSTIKRNSWKIQSNALFGVYEFYACREVGRRVSLKAPQMCHCFMNPRSIVVTPAKSIMIYNYYKAFSLLDVCNRLKQKFEYQISEPTALTILKMLLEMVSTLHECNFIHGDIKPDNILLMDPTTLSKKEEWAMSLKLIDFGRCIDIGLFDACNEVKFVGKSNTADFECIEMLENKPWKFSVDLYGIIASIHVLIFKNYMKPYKITAQSGTLWKITNSVKRSWDKNFWNQLFDVVLNKNLAINHKTCSNLLTQVIKKLHDYSEDQIDRECCEFLKNLF